MQVEAISVIRPALTLKKDSQGEIKWDTGVWSAAEITANLDPFDVTGPHEEVKVTLGNESWDYTKVIMVLAPGHTPVEGEPTRFILVFRTVRYSLTNRSNNADSKV